jgi:hypothetical protein
VWARTENRFLFLSEKNIHIVTYIVARQRTLNSPAVEEVVAEQTDIRHDILFKR